MSVGVADFKVNYHFEIGGRVVGSPQVDHVQVASRSIPEDSGYAGKTVLVHATADSLRTVLAANGRAYPGAVIVVDGVATMTAGTSLLA